ncbi:MAG: hypothetical protein AB1626_03725 [Candidatus Micrarchaeota archaeon]
MKADRQEYYSLEEEAAINSEIRFIVLELMKISASTGKPFEEVANEFCENASQLKKALHEAAAPVRQQRRRTKRV